jgi:hypothetical protein
MRPIVHLGVGHNSPDYELYLLDERLYGSLQERGESLLEENRVSFMGEEFKQLPTETRDDLMTRLNRLLDQKETLLRIKAPPALIEDLDFRIAKLYNSIEKFGYSLDTDKYRIQFYEKLEAWNDSVEKQELVEAIQAYNEQQYERIKNRKNNE